MEFKYRVNFKIKKNKKIQIKKGKQQKSNNTVWFDEEDKVIANWYYCWSF